MNIFISFSGAAREQYAVKFLNFFNKHGIAGWYDQHELYLGDDLKNSIISKGINETDYGILIINKLFLSRNWPCEEAKLLYERYVTEKNIVLFPILLDITKNDLKNSQLNFLLQIKYQFLKSGEDIDNIGYQILNRIFIDILERNRINTFRDAIINFKRLTLHDSANIYNALCLIENFDSNDYRDKTILLICLIKILDNTTYDKIIRIISYKIYNNDVISFDMYKITESIFLISTNEILNLE